MALSRCCRLSVKNTTPALLRATPTTPPLMALVLIMGARKPSGETRVTFRVLLARGRGVGGQAVPFPSTLQMRVLLMLGADTLNTRRR